MSDFTKSDMVSHPAHYISEDGIEVIDVIKAFTKEMTGMEAVCTANAIKYVLRWKNKNGVEDIKKAIWYLNKLVSVKESGASMDEEEKDKQDDSWRSDFTPQMLSDFKKGKFGYIVPTDKLSSFLWHLNAIDPKIRWNSHANLVDWKPDDDDIADDYIVLSMLYGRSGMTWCKLKHAFYDTLKEHEYFVCAEGCNPYELVAKGYISAFIKDSDSYEKFLHGLNCADYCNDRWKSTVELNVPNVIDVNPDPCSPVMLVSRPIASIDICSTKNIDRLIFDLEQNKITWLRVFVVENQLSSYDEDHLFKIADVVDDFVNGIVGVVVHDKSEWRDFANLVLERDENIRWRSGHAATSYRPGICGMEAPIIVTAVEDAYCSCPSNRIGYWSSGLFCEIGETDDIYTFYDLKEKTLKQVKNGKLVKLEEIKD